MLWNIHGTPKDVSVNISSSGDNTIVSGSTIGRNLIHALSLVAASAVTVTIKLGSRTVGTFALSAGGSINLSNLASQEGGAFYECLTGEAFIINLSGAVNVTGTVKYSNTSDVVS
jgi:hypothetical protein